MPLKVLLALAVVPCLAFGLVAARPATNSPPDPPPTAPLPPASGDASSPAPGPAGDPDDPKLAGHLAGRVVGPEGNPVAGARIYLVADPAKADGPGPVRTRSGADGRFAFDAPDLTFTARDGLAARRPGFLIAAADGLAPDGLATWGRSEWPTYFSPRQVADPVKGDEPVLRLDRDDVPIRGRLLDSQGRPVAGARVRLSALMVPPDRNLIAYLKKRLANPNVYQSLDRLIDRPLLLPGIDRATTTDAEGRFTLARLGANRLADLTITAPGFVAAKVQVMTRDAPDIILSLDDEGNATDGIRGADFTLRLPLGRATTLSGVVRDRDTHQPIPGMTVATGYYGPNPIQRR